MGIEIMQWQSHQPIQLINMADCLRWNALWHVHACASTYVLLSNQSCWKYSRYTFHISSWLLESILDGVIWRRRLEVLERLPVPMMKIYRDWLKCHDCGWDYGVDCSNPLWMASNGKDATLIRWEYSRYGRFGRPYWEAMLKLLSLEV